ncbi:MAG TPA: hypothetical protein VHX59_15195 [Mycobacteriales bacterium]|nr:hypothetical protein [Mycobacteriales bacterium]
MHVDPILHVLGVSVVPDVGQPQIGQYGGDAGGVVDPLADVGRRTERGEEIDRRCGGSGRRGVGGAGPR